MSDIRIDTSNLTYTQFLIPGQSSEFIEGVNVPTLSLDPGTYSFQQASGLLGSFNFTITSDGFIDYDISSEAFLNGRGTTTLTIRGLTITLDGRQLSHDLLPFGSKDVLSRDRTHELIYVPAVGYGFQSASGVVADFWFELTVDGQIEIDPRYAGFASAIDRTLTISGYKITIDGRALSHDLIPSSLLGNNEIMGRAKINELTYIPAVGYGFQSASGVVADFRFELTVDGQIAIDPRYRSFASATDRTLTISGYRIVIDGRTLSHDLLPLSLLGNDGILSRTSTNELTYIPAVGYGFQSGAGIVADFYFELTVDGQIAIDPRYAGFAAAIDTTLTISGYRIVIDGRALSHNLLPLSLLGNDEILAQDIVHNFNLLPGQGYGFFSSGSTVVIFNIDVTGTIVVYPLYSGMAYASGNLLVIGQANPLIDTIQAPATARPGESVRLQIVLKPDAPADTQVTVNKLSALDVLLQAPGRLGKWEIPVTAAVGKRIDLRVVTMEIAGTPVAPVIQIANNPFAPLSIVLRAVDIDSENKFLVASNVYKWRIGEIEATTTEPLIARDLTSQVDNQQAWISLAIQLTVVHADGSTQNAERTLVLGSTYRHLRDSLNQVRPPILTDGQAKQIGLLESIYRSRIQIRNIEPTGINFTLRRIEWLVTDSEDASFGPDESIDLRMDANSLTSVDVEFNSQQAPPGTSDAIIHMFGQTDDGLPVHTSAAFELIRFRSPNIQILPDLFRSPTLLDRVATIVDAQGGDPFILGAMTGGLVRLPENVRASGLDQSHIWSLQLAAEAFGREPEPTTFNSKQVSTFAASIQSREVEWSTKDMFFLDGLSVARNAVEVREGGSCDANNLPDEIPEFFACQFTGEYEEKLVPARVANARKGDIILVPGGNGLIGGLLTQLSPLQRYAHCGIMTKNFVEVSHSTASDKWLQDHAQGVVLKGKIQPTDGFDPTALRYQWPGGIIQSIESAYGGSEFTNPDIEVEEDDPQNPGQKIRVKKKYKLTAFSLVDKAFLESQWQIIEPLVLKPHPVAEHNDLNLRKRLHQVADEVRKLCVTEEDTKAGQQSKVHYRFYCYTDAAIAVRPNQFGVIGPAPDRAGWAAGTLPTVCSSIIWLAAHRAGFQLEGSGEITKPSDLEPPDILAGAQTDEQTRDGLYFYTEGERRAAAKWLFNYLKDRVLNTVQEEAGGILGDLLEAFSDMADDCANQITNTFAFDWADTEAKDSERWENPGVGRAISPDNMMLWDRPEQGGQGLWGYFEPLVHYPARIERIPVTKWHQTTGPGTIQGTVRFRDRPVPGANLNAGGTMITAGGDGKFSITLLAGRYALQASAFIDPAVGLVSTTVDVEVKFNETMTMDVNLQLPPDQYRLVEIDAFMEFRDDEDFDPDETSLDSKIWRLPVQPGDIEETVSYTKGWGGECRIEANITAKLNFDRSIDVTISGKLFEETSENPEENQDLDGQGSATWTIPKDAVDVWKELKIQNTDEDEPDTYALFKLKITNRTQ
jgi:hypothetical protein